MHKITRPFTFVIAAIGVALIAMGAQAVRTDQPPLNDKEINRYVPNEAFGFGERLEYRLGYKFITAGTAVFEVLPNPVYRQGRPCYDIRFGVRSLESLEWIYKVHDKYRTVLDVGAIFPWDFEQHNREGGYSHDYSASFDQVAHIARTTEGEFEIPPYVHDIVSAFYYVRTQDLKSYTKNAVIPLKNFYNKDNYDLGVKILGKQQVEVEAGKFNCIVIEPLIKEGGLFRAEGRILIWLTNDERRIPVKVSTRIPIGTIDAELTSYRGLRGPLTSKVE